MAQSEYLRDALANGVLRGAAFTNPGDVWLALHNANPGLTGAGEIGAGRKAITFVVSTSGVLTNSVEVEWVDFPITTTVTHVSIWTDATAGQCLLVAPLQDSVSVQAGQGVRVGAGAITTTWA